MDSVPEQHRHPARTMNMTGTLMLGNLGVVFDNQQATAAIIPFDLLHDMGLGAVHHEIERRLTEHETGDRK